MVDVRPIAKLEPSGPDIVTVVDPDENTIIVYHITPSHSSLNMHVTLESNTLTSGHLDNVVTFQCPTIIRIKFYY